MTGKPWLFTPGNNANPSGRRPEVARGVVMLDKNSALAVGKLVELLESKTESIRLAAAREVLDRVYGKPKVSVDVQTTDVAQIHLQLLQEVQRRREERLKTIDGKVEDPVPAPHTESPNAATTIEDLI